jgi:hypothetical protein
MSILRRDRDGEGYCGSRVEAIDPITREVVDNKPVVGKILLVGTMTAGTFTSRDYWKTTPIVEILSEDHSTIKFRTQNSTYTFVK